jgi:uncharacterized protein (UPF0332 family)
MSPQNPIHDRVGFTFTISRAYYGAFLYARALLLMLGDEAREEVAAAHQFVAEAKECS